MAERMLGFGVGEAAPVPRVGESKHRGGTAGGLVDADLIPVGAGHGTTLVPIAVRSKVGAIVRRRAIRSGRARRRSAAAGDARHPRSRRAGRVRARATRRPVGGPATATAPSGPTAAASGPRAARRARRARWPAVAASKKPSRRSASGESTSRANGSSSPRSQAAAGIENPRLGPCTIARGTQRRDRPAQQALLRRGPRTFIARRQRERELGDGRVEERHAHLERVGHARAVGLHEQVVGEVDAEVDVLQAGERSARPRSRRSGRGSTVERVGAAPVGAEQRGAARPARRSPSSRDGARAGAAAPRATKRLAL